MTTTIENYCIDCKTVAKPDCDSRGHVVGTLGQTDSDSDTEHHDTPAAPERGEWRKSRTVGKSCRIDDDSGAVAMVRDEITAELILREHNQHPTLITQRERLLAFVKEFADKGCVCNGETCLQRKIHPCIRCRASELITTSEQEGRTER